MNSFEKQWDDMMTNNKDEYIDAKIDALAETLAEIDKEGYTDVCQVRGAILNRIETLSKLKAGSDE